MPRSLGLLALALAGSLPLAAPPQHPPATDPSAAGLKALEERRYDAAAAAFRAALAADPKDYAAHFNLAFALGMLGQDAEAVQHYQETLRLQPGLYEAELNLGILLLRQKQAPQAVVHLEAAAAKKPDQFRPVFFLAGALAAANRVDEAESRYRAATALDPKSAAAESGWGRLLLGSGKLTEAAPHLQQAAQLEASYADGILELASAYEQQKQPDQAIAIYRQFPANPAAQERLGNLLLETGHPDGAVTVLEFVVAQSPTAANRYALATAFLRTKQPDKALASIDQALQAEPGNLDLHLVRGRLLRDQKRYPQAAQEFYRVVEARPDSKEAWSELAGMLVLMEQYPQALGALDKVQTLGGETAGICYLRAIVLDKTKMLEPALAAYRRFLELSKNQNPDEEFKARQRARIIERELSKR